MCLFSLLKHRLQRIWECIRHDPGKVFGIHVSWYIVLTSSSACQGWQHFKWDMLDCVSRNCRGKARPPRLLWFASISQVMLIFQLTPLWGRGKRMADQDISPDSLFHIGPFPKTARWIVTHKTSLPPLIKKLYQQENCCPYCNLCLVSTSLLMQSDFLDIVH